MRLLLLFFDSHIDRSVDQTCLIPACFLWIAVQTVLKWTKSRTSTMAQLPGNQGETLMKKCPIKKCSTCQRKKISRVTECELHCFLVCNWLTWMCWSDLKALLRAVERAFVLGHNLAGPRHGLRRQVAPFPQQPSPRSVSRSRRLRFRGLETWQGISNTKHVTKQRFQTFPNNPYLYYMLIIVCTSPCINI